METAQKKKESLIAEVSKNDPRAHFFDAVGEAAKELAKRKVVSGVNVTAFMEVINAEIKERNRRPHVAAE